MGTGKDAGYSEEKALRTLAEAELAIHFADRDIGISAVKGFDLFKPVCV